MRAAAQRFGPQGAHAVRRIRNWRVPVSGCAANLGLGWGLRMPGHRDEDQRDRCDTQTIVAHGTSPVHDTAEIAV
jgi:hypothetical protein